MIYFIQGTVTGNIKIGKTKSFERRFNGVSSSDVLVCLKVIVDSDDESKYHNLFKHLWSHGEWFKPGKDLLDFIKSLRKNKYAGLKQDVLPSWKRLKANKGRKWVYRRTKNGKTDWRVRIWLKGKPKKVKVSKEGVEHREGVQVKITPTVPKLSKRFLSRYPNGMTNFRPMSEERAIKRIFNGGVETPQQTVSSQMSG